MRQHYEHKSQPLLPRRLFLLRLLRHLIVALGFMAGALFIGVLGYHVTEHMTWLDSLLNASMLLGGMGPVDPVKTSAGKLFASFYALFAGVVFLVIAGIIVAPIAHRILHRLHLEQQNEPSEGPNQ
jgi:hypothetical protein